MSLQCVQRNNQQISATQLIVPANTPAAVKAVLFERLGRIFRPKIIKLPFVQSQGRNITIINDDDISKPCDFFVLNVLNYRGKSNCLFRIRGY